MPTTLTNGIQLPDKGSVDWYNSMQSNYNLIDTHLGNTDIHVTAEDKANWDSKQGSLSQAQLDAIAQVSTNTNDIATLQSGKANVSHTHSSSDITDIGDYATKQYVDNSISGLVDSAPNALDTLNELAAALNDDANFASTVTTALSAKANSVDLATVATSGSYNDLSNKPTINDSTITIQKNGSLVGTFTVNGSAKIIDIPVPIKTSDLTNDSNFVDTSNSAVASGITSAKVTDYDTHIANTNIHVTTADKTKWNNGVSQSYVLRYSSSSVTDNSTIAYSTLDNTDNIKLGDKVIDVDGKIFSIVSVDTANSTVTVGSALIDLALDANVVHTSGDETVGGEKTFSSDIIRGTASNNTTIQKKYIIGNYTASTTGSDSSSYLSIVATLNYSDGTPSKSASVSLYAVENAYSTGKFFVFRPNSNNLVDLGTNNKRWANVFATNYYYGSNNVEFSTKFVTTDTAQSITAVKTITDANLELKSTSAEYGVSAGDSSIIFKDKNNRQTFKIYSRVFASGVNNNLVNFFITQMVDNIYYNGNGIQLHAGTNDKNVVLRPILANNNADGLSVSLGSRDRKWKDCQTYLINGLTPSSLGMPSDRSARVDISGYFTNMASGDTNTYTAPSNGWIYLALNDVTAVNLASQTSGGLTNYGDYRSRSSNGALLCLFPIRSGDVFVSQWYTTTTVTVTNAYFIPCQGNI